MHFPELRVSSNFELRTSSFGTSFELRASSSLLVYFSLVGYGNTSDFSNSFVYLYSRIKTRKLASDPNLDAAADARIISNSLD